MSRTPVFGPGPAGATEALLVVDGEVLEGDGVSQGAVVRQG